MSRKRTDAYRAKIRKSFVDSDGYFLKSVSAGDRSAIKELDEAVEAGDRTSAGRAYDKLSEAVAGELGPPILDD